MWCMGEGLYGEREVCVCICVFMCVCDACVCVRVHVVYVLSCVHVKCMCMYCISLAALGFPSKHEQLGTRLCSGLF